MRDRSKPRLSELNVPPDLTDQLRLRLENLSPSAKADYLKETVFSKYVSPETDPPEVRRTRAINKWLATERENEATNVRLIITSEEYNLLPRVGYGRFVNWCRDFLLRILGETPPLDSLIGSFSGGASTSRPRTRSHPAGKYVGEAHITPRAQRWYDVLVDEIPPWLSEPGTHKTVVVPGNVLFTVPKKANIDRAACKEPDINMFLQKGVGACIRSRLRRYGIDLNDQSINRRLAHQGSITGESATLDLSSASDSVSTGLVELLLPSHWFELLSDLRSEVTLIDGEEHRNEMFSSMGNGFTFELESLLFFTLAKATAYFRGISGVISVYGDDIIVPSRLAEDLIWVLRFFGFETNPDKSFWTGFFRESCGGHYLHGADITPFYIKGPLTTVMDVIHVANSLRKWIFQDYPSPSERGMAVVCLDQELEEIWQWLKSLVPQCLWGGRDLSFKYQLVSDDEPSYRLHPIRVKKEVDEKGAYLQWLNATWKRSGVDEAVITSATSAETGKFRIRRVRPNAVTSIRTLFYHELCDVPDLPGIVPQNPATPVGAPE